MADIYVDNDMIKIAEIYERFEEHIKLKGKPHTNDKWIWKTVDSMTEQQLCDLTNFASDNKFYDLKMEEWIEEVAERKPFFIRQNKDKNKSRKNNEMIWKLMMNAREVIKSRLNETHIDKLFEQPI